ncbi:MAG TPA: bifunctional riboflavin kinase/FAD synthetase [Flavitalea sp.]|nr:bifunctional riboflavin kinase/FAD synthetase [Flavitalea sp.]
MKVYQYTDQLPYFKNAVITIGTFDGVHQGHRQIIHHLREVASEVSGETVIITFHPHPRSILQHQDVQLINTMEERIRLLDAAGIDNLVIVPFTDAFSQLTAEQYVEHFLVEHFHPHTIIIGYDHRFGHGRKGDYRMLEAYAASGLFQLREIPEHLINNNAVSSTRIRKSILHGQIEEANRLLGYPFFFSGTVVHGKKLGRRLGYPTANIYLSQTAKLVPSNGIYAVTASIDNTDSVLHKGMMSIGIRPTIGGTERTIEVNLFDFDKDIYDLQVEINVHAYLRAEEKFDDLALLTEQIGRDKVAALDVLGIVQ